jgi:hypothetical protein
MKIRLAPRAVRTVWALTMVAVVLPATALVDARQHPHSVNVYPPITWSSQHLYCQSAFRIETCEKELTTLKESLRAYPLNRLGPWNWVLIRSDEWASLTRRLGLDALSPAFTSLDDRATFLNDALISPDPRYQTELLRAFHLPMHRLLRVAIAHELAHALCRVMDEAAAAALGEHLRHGGQPPCATAEAAP